MRLRDLLDIPELRLVLRTATDRCLDRPIRWVYVTELLDPGRYLSGNELVLTGLMWHRTADDSDTFAATAAAAGASAIAAGTAVHGTVPDDFVAACRRHRLPLVEVPIDVSFGTVSELVTRRLSAERATGLATALGRHRRLVGAAAEGDGLDPVFALARRDLGLDCWVISASGRVVSGARMAPRRARELAAGFRGAERLPCVVNAGAPFTLVPVDTRSGHRLAGWFLACEGVLAERDPEVRESVEELAALAALEWARLEEGRRVERRLAGRLVDLAAEAEPAAVAAQMRACGLSPREPYAVVAASVGGGETAAAAAFLDDLLGEVHRGPAEDGPGATRGAGDGDGGGVPVAVLGDAAVAIVPLRCGDGTPSVGGAGEPSRARSERAAAPAARPGNTAQARNGAQAGNRGQAEAIAAAGAGAGETAVEPFVRMLRDRVAGLTAPAAPRHASRQVAPRAGSSARSPGVAGPARGRAAACAAGAAQACGIAMGVSGPAYGPEAMRAALDEARHAHRLALVRPGSPHVVTSDEIQSHALLLASVPESVRRLFRDRLLGPLLDYDRKNGSELVATLRAFLDCSGSWNKCASTLHIHVNTLRYRIRRIEELTGRDLGSLETRVDFFLALEAA